MTPPEPAPPLARPFVVTLVLLMLASALFVWEPWPLTSFRLFSHLRTDEQSAWQATTVDATGHERPYPLSAGPLGQRNFGFAMAEFERASQARRDEMCRAWVTSAPAAVGVRALEVRISRRTWRLSERDGERAEFGTLEHEFTCTEEAARIAD